MKKKYALSSLAIFTLLLPVIAEASFFSYGSPYLFNNAVTEYLAVTNINSTHVLAVYQDGNTIGRAAVGTVDGTDITFGTEYSFNGGGNAKYMDVDMLDDTRAIISYADDSNDGYAVIATVSGTTLTFGTAANFTDNIGSGGDSDKTAIAVLDSTHVVISYFNTDPGMNLESSSDDIREGRVIAASISGTDITFGSPETLSSDGVVYHAITPLDSTHFVASYTESVGDTHAIVGTISDTTLSIGSSVEWTSYGVDTQMEALDSTHVLAVYRGNDAKGYARILTISGASISVGSATQVIAVRALELALTKLSSTKAALVFSAWDSGRRGETVLLTISDTTVSAGVSSIFYSQQSNQSMDVTSLDGSTIVPIVSDATNSYKGYAFAGSILFTAPTVSAFSPIDNAPHQPLTTNLSITFDHTIGKTGTGTVSIYKVYDNSLVETISVTSSQVTGSGTTQITIDPTADLELSNGYYIRVSSNAFPDTSGNFFAGITSDSVWNFSTATLATSSSSNSSQSNQGGGGGGGRGGDSAGGRTAQATTTASRSTPSPGTTPSPSHPAANTQKTANSPDVGTVSTTQNSPAAPASTPVSAPVARMMEGLQARLETRVQQQIAAKPSLAPTLNKMLQRMNKRIAKLTRR